MSTDKSTDAGVGVTSEHVMLVVILVIASYMLVESFQFAQSAAFFPQFAGSVTIVGTVLLLIREYLPSPLYEYVAESTDVLSSYSDETDWLDEDATAADTDKTRGRPITAASFTVAALVAYVIGAYIVGLLWVTPIFVLGYTSWFRLEWIARIGLSITGFVITYGFMVLLNVDLHKGFLLVVV
ncbi:tripartite tricarboxylate transporter TctB family protein [Natrinema gelatinilyticum]|uniref:tripartite tricarboxylate transporter TctB family protein n=1 Tax=Natrinema gelatinilyticum TaxID=2961571 RepID=UPI0020C498FA|nr:tripartite tricarboxylate transporter TctB family protein [Natrinema gelatinilyticum]